VFGPSGDLVVIEPRQCIATPTCGDRAVVNECPPMAGEISGPHRLSDRYRMEHDLSFHISAHLEALLSVDRVTNVVE